MRSVTRTLPSPPKAASCGPLLHRNGIGRSAQTARAPDVTRGLLCARQRTRRPGSGADAERHDRPDALRGVEPLHGRCRRPRGAFPRGRARGSARVRLTSSVGTGIRIERLTNRLQTACTVGAGQQHRRVALRVPLGEGVDHEDEELVAHALCGNDDRGGELRPRPGPRHRVRRRSTAGRHLVPFERDRAPLGGHHGIPRRRSGRRLNSDRHRRVQQTARLHRSPESSSRRDIRTECEALCSARSLVLSLSLIHI